MGTIFLGGGSFVFWMVAFCVFCVCVFLDGFSHFVFFVFQVSVFLEDFWGFLGFLLLLWRAWLFFVYLYVILLGLYSFFCFRANSRCSHASAVGRG